MKNAAIRILPLPIGLVISAGVIHVSTIITLSITYSWLVKRFKLRICPYT
ncbi:hypothetical protein TSMEX_004257 [Taenia solium]|eukprot:TsM_000496400 transcript=TsM_000496400 gene=TsM_000496400